MNAAGSRVQLSFLGRRIERLLYVGFILTIVAALELLASQAGTDSVQHDSEILSRAIENIKSKQDNLEILFKQKNSPKTQPVVNQKVAPEIERTRKLLGLEPHVEKTVNIEEKTSQKRTYEDQLLDLLTESGSEKILLTEEERSRQPKDVIEILNSKLSILTSRPALAWNVETERKFKFQYFGSSTTVPITLTATVLVIILIPITIVWLGSLRITRQRELIVISQIDDFKQTFPHFLNIVSVTTKLMLVSTHQKLIRQNQLIARFWTSAMRLLGIILVISPLLIFVISSCVNVLNYYSNIPWFIILPLVVSALILFFEILNILFHEIYYLRNKDFYEN